MSEENKINVKYLQTLVLQESENDAVQDLDSDFYISISKSIGNLKNKELNGIEAKIQNNLVEMMSELVSFLLKLRIEKAALGNSNSSSALLDVEKYILDSQKEMEERKEAILTKILNGKSKLLESNNQ
jgi:DNA replication factor GINS|tara:strand:- start:374 stop:757 length:384 start_codon:yes stop_codon:yes gene_type:complete